MTALQCNRCRFWCEEMKHRDPNDTEWGFGQCWRKPPVLMECMVKPQLAKLEYGQQVDLGIDAVQASIASVWPATHSHDWCGKFEKREA
jgi:hypothetical protein